MLALDKKYPHWLNKEEMKKLNKQNETYKSLSAEEQLLIDLLEWDANEKDWLQLTASEICTVLDVNNGRSPLMAKALRRLNERGIEAPKTNKNRRYKIPPFKRKEQNNCAQRLATGNW